MEEVASLIRAVQSQLTEDDFQIWQHQLPSPMLKRYLQVIHLRIDNYAVWHSNVVAGFIALPDDSNIRDIVVEKSKKKYRPADELWLAIQGSHRISELLSTILGVEDFAGVMLDGSVFSRVFVLAYNGTYEWRRDDVWRQLNGAD